jgi:hypothetical protein
MEPSISAGGAARAFAFCWPGGAKTNTLERNAFWFILEPLDPEDPVQSEPGPCGRLPENRATARHARRFWASMIESYLNVQEAKK